MSGVVAQTFIPPVFAQAGPSLDTSADAPAASILDDPDVVAALAAEDPAQIEAAFARYRWETDGRGTARLAEKVTPQMLAALKGRPPSAAHVFAAVGAGGSQKAIPGKSSERMEVIIGEFGGPSRRVTFLELVGTGGNETVWSPQVTESAVRYSVENWFRVSPQDVIPFFTVLERAGARLGFDTGFASFWSTSGHIVAVFEDDHVRLVFRSYTVFRRSWWRVWNLRDRFLFNREGYNGTKISIEAELLRQEDRNKLNRRLILRGELEKRVAPLLAPDSPLEMSAGKGGFVIRVAGVAKSADSLPVIMNRRGRFLGSL